MSFLGKKGPCPLSAFAHDLNLWYAHCPEGTRVLLSWLQALKFAPFIRCARINGIGMLQSKCERRSCRWIWLYQINSDWIDIWDSFKKESLIFLFRNKTSGGREAVGLGIGGTFKSSSRNSNRSSRGSRGSIQFDIRRGFATSRKRISSLREGG